MYGVYFKSSGVIAARFLDRTNAKFWAWINDLDHEGNPMGLFIVKKVKA
jgi:hypothetical protein